MASKYKIELTPKQAELVINSLMNESYDDPAEWNEYSFFRCYRDVAKKLIKQGFFSEALRLDGFERCEAKK